MKKVNESKREIVQHTFPPIYNSDSRILILGTFPSVKSRETEFYYGHPQNRFWQVIARIFEVEVPRTNDEKKKLLINSHIALWDVIESCEIIGSSDSSIQNVVPNDLNIIFENSDIKQVYANGKTAGKLYEKFGQISDGRQINILPSTSPANAAYSVERLVRCWEVIRE